MDAVLVATVGAEPQVVTLAADLLLQQGPLVRAVVVFITRIEVTREGFLRQGGTIPCD